MVKTERKTVARKKSTTISQEEVTLISNSLIPIKGVDEKRREYLKEIEINTAADLLKSGRTIAQRKFIAEHIMAKEKEEIESSEKAKWTKRYCKYVDSWVKQVDLWRVPGIDVDTAFFLVELGVRHVEDLRLVVPEKAHTMMSCLVNTQADYTLISLDKLRTIIDHAGTSTTKNSLYQKNLQTLLSSAITKVPGRKELLSDVEKMLSQIRIEDIIGGSVLEFDEAAPEYLFADSEIEEVKAETTKNAKILSDGVRLLREIDDKLPLPKVLKGRILYQKSGEGLKDVTAFSDVLVELEGIASPNEDKTEGNSLPSCMTDLEGKFLISLPDNYNMQETLTLYVSKGPNKQRFLLNASDIISHTEKNDILDAFNELEIIEEDIEKEKEKLEKIELLIEEEQERNASQKTESEDNLTDEEENSDNLEETKESENEIKRREIQEEITLLEKRLGEVERLIKYSDQTTNDFNKIYRNIMNSTNLISDFWKEPFIVNEEAFQENENIYKKVLPSVKLMEKDDESIFLPTDTAPSRVFNYSMIQRLVEPEVSPAADEFSGSSRIPLTKGIDVMSFTTKMIENPDSIPQMSSLGIGYVLNMHQSWTPDGFALGTLLYSLVLAPGEEQRLIVRENKQSYTIIDNAEGSEGTSETYVTSQTDNTTAAYDYALSQLSEGKSSYDYTTRASAVGASGGVAGVGGGFGAMLGLSASTSKSSGSASSSASQSNSHNEASNAAQDFQHEIKTASEKISQAQRVSVSMATSEESDSVATRIIANHNHSHAMTIQYWEVMRRYKLETCIDGVDLVLFVPLKMIPFLPNKESFILGTPMNMEKFETRYQTILKYADLLESQVPWKYRTGLSLIKKYAAEMNWVLENEQHTRNTVVLEFKALFFEFEDISAKLVLKNGKGTIAGDFTYQRKKLSDKLKTTVAVLDAIREARINTASHFTYHCTFELPSNVSKEDISYVQLQYDCKQFTYDLYKDPDDIAMNDDTMDTVYEKMLDRMWDLAKDNKQSDNDIKRIDYYKNLLPEAWLSPSTTISASQIREQGAPIIQSTSLKIAEQNEILDITMNSSQIYSVLNITVSNSTTVMRRHEVQQMEEALHHVASNTLKYSQLVWASLSSDERAIMLEKYTIDMDFSEIADNEEINQTGSSKIDISLLNCINVKKLLGFYGNCMLFPFTYPEDLAKKINVTSAELQNSLYRYHTNYFRVPTTTISLPTDGMIGEAVLGETNVSEEIDLTRFWNWKDSPIDSMSIDSSYLNGTDYLSGKSTKDISALNLQGATATTPVSNADLITALVGKQTPSFNNITGLDQLQSVLNAATESAGKGRDTAMSTSADMAKTSMEYAYKSAELEASKEKQKNQQNDDQNQGEGEGSDNSGDNTGGNNTGNSGDNRIGNTGGNNTGNTGGNNTGNTGGNNTGNTGGDNTGNTGGNNTGNTGGDNTGNTGGNHSGNVNKGKDGSLDDSNKELNPDDEGAGSEDKEGLNTSPEDNGQSEIKSPANKMEFDEQLLFEIINGMLDFIGQGKKPEDYFASLTGNKISGDELVTIARKVSEEQGIIFNQPE